MTLRSGLFWLLLLCSGCASSPANDFPVCKNDGQDPINCIQAKDYERYCFGSRGGC